MAVVYAHRRLDTNEIFYIGIGLRENRAYQKRSRNPLWKNIVEKVGYSIEFILKDISYEKAKEVEKELISFYGRKDKKTGCLSNMTSGGDGCSDISDEQRNRISEKLKGKIQSQETKNKRILTSKKTWANPELRELKSKQAKLLNELGIIGTKGKSSKKKGTKLSEDVKEKISNNLRVYYQDNKPHNFISIDEEIKKNIIDDYNDGISQFRLHKLYGFSRSVIKRIIKEYENYKNG